SANDLAEEAATTDCADESVVDQDFVPGRERNGAISGFKGAAPVKMDAAHAITDRMLRGGKIHAGSKSNRPASAPNQMRVVPEQNVVPSLERQQAARVADAGAEIQVPSRALNEGNVMGGFQVDLGEANKGRVNVQ